MAASVHSGGADGLSAESQRCSTVRFGVPESTLGRMGALPFHSETSLASGPVVGRAASRLRTRGVLARPCRQSCESTERGTGPGVGKSFDGRVSRLPARRALRVSACMSPRDRLTSFIGPQGTALVFRRLLLAFGPIGFHPRRLRFPLRGTHATSLLRSGGHCGGERILRRPATALHRRPQGFDCPIELVPFGNQKGKDMFCAHLSEMVASLLSPQQHFESRWRRLPACREQQGDHRFERPSVILEAALLRRLIYADC